MCARLLLGADITHSSGVLPQALFLCWLLAGDSSCSAQLLTTPVLSLSPLQALYKQLLEPLSGHHLPALESLPTGASSSWDLPAVLKEARSEASARTVLWVPVARVWAQRMLG